MDSRSDHLIELYKTAREEFHQQERTYVQAFIGLGILIPVFIGAISLLFGKDTPLDLVYITPVKIGIFLFVIIVAAFFLIITLRINGRFKVCKKTCHSIEKQLYEEENTEECSKLKGLLIGEELEEGKADNWFGRYRFWFYIPLGLAALVAMGLFLFMFIA